MKTPKLLSTKVLQPAQRSRLLAAGFAVQSYNAVIAQPITFEMPATPFQAIFTSQNAVAAFLDHPHMSTALSILEGAYVVGERSAQKLRKKGIQVHAVADSAKALAQLLFPSEFKLRHTPVYYFCGQQHLSVLPEAFAAAQASLHTTLVYKTRGVTTPFNTPFEVLFFYSPSGINAFTAKNTIGQAFVVAIGPTTATAVAVHTQNFVVAKKPSFAHMLSALRAHFKPNAL